jgi:hypothetical protein
MPNKVLLWGKPTLRFGLPQSTALAGDEEMDLLMFVPLLMFVLISIGLGAIPGVLAKRKHRSRTLWWVGGAFCFPFALVSILCFRNFEQIPDAQKAGSKLKEKIILVIIIILWVAMVASRVQMAKQ